MVLLITYFVSHIADIHAEYVLPYPSYMPGNSMYRFSRALDVLKGYWYWGNIAQIKYHLGLSDKYLVEAKTLFEYKQYLLATDALVRSDKELLKIPTYLSSGDNQIEDLSEQRKIISMAMETHERVIKGMENQLPQTFVWQPEKANPTSLNIAGMISSSLVIRNTIGTIATQSSSL